jgi:hypothetical protein
MPMKFICAIILLFSVTYTSAQTEKPGDPIVNFVNKGEVTVKDYQLSTNYYTLKNNLANRSSKAYVADRPTLAQVTAAALRMPSEMYKVSKKGVELNMILFVAGGDNTFLVIEPLAKSQAAFKSELTGVITENRAKELIREKYDPAAVIKGEQLTFNKGQYLIIPDAKIKAALIALIEKEGLSNEGPAGSSLTYAEIHQQIIAESKEGGKFDFFTPIKGKEYDEKQLKPNLIVTSISAALYEWGKANATLGVKSVQDALAYFSEVNARSLSNREIEFITLGFEDDLVKKGDGSIK